jgi:hypothetical protein
MRRVVAQMTSAEFSIGTNTNNLVSREPVRHFGSRDGKRLSKRAPPDFVDKALLANTPIVEREAIAIKLTTRAYTSCCQRKSWLKSTVQPEVFHHHRRSFDCHNHEFLPVGLLM